MSLLVKWAAVASSLLLAVTVRSQEGFPLDGTWRGEWGPDGGKTTVVIVMKWDGKNVNGMINPPGPTRYGHSIGHWEGDTLVVDAVGFAASFWMNRLGLPHTEQLRTIERISRPNFDTLIYEVTIDDPGAYTATWSGGFYLSWRRGNEPFGYLCQDNNLDPERLVGPTIE